ncbi:MAG: hypothetical protein IJP62_05620 [Treponema sp.]|nr:hypothetical protein [Treponema sp.]
MNDFFNVIHFFSNHCLSRIVGCPCFFWLLTKGLRQFVVNAEINFDKAKIYQNIKTWHMDKSGMYEHDRTERQKKSGRLI